MSTDSVYKMEIIKTKSEALRNEVNSATSGTMSNESYEGTGEFDFNSDFLDNFSNSFNPINQSQLNTGSNLVEVLKQSSQMTASSINDLTNAMNNISNTISRGALSTDNLGINLKSVLGGLVSQTAVGNRIQSLGIELDTLHKEAQTDKNIAQMEELNFNKEGNPNLKDSNGEQIKPRESVAKASAEKIDALKFEKFGEDGLNNSQDQKIIPRKDKARKDSEVAWDMKEINSTVVDDVIGYLDDMWTGIMGGDSEGDVSEVFDNMELSNPFNEFLEILRDESQKQQANLKGE